jgi:hypothetical protein
MIKRAHKRYLDLLCSVYVYNEHRGYTSLDRVLAAVRDGFPDDRAFIAKIEKHRADEFKHYLMFKRWFQQRGEMPYLVDEACGQIDGIIELCFGTEIETLDTEAVIASEAEFGKLCRVIALTERRGMRLIEGLLSSPLVLSDRNLVRILQVVERDEPSHWSPYEEWLESHGGLKPRAFERFADAFVNAAIVFAKMPVMFANPRLRRRTDWPDEHDGAPVPLTADGPVGALAQ